MLKKRTFQLEEEEKVVLPKESAARDVGRKGPSTSPENFLPYRRRTLAPRKDEYKQVVACETVNWEKVIMVVILVYGML
uniref:Uncharacterized protein n=1 Tax=Panagrolaimus sp. ES5 TaxID=591445 RepID=A0AC34G2W3_9BILA